MALNAKGSRKIVVDGHEFRWRAKQRSGFINLTIWPSANDNLRLTGRTHYTYDFNDECSGKYICTYQAVITSRVVKAIIEHFGINELHQQKGQINLGAIENYFDMSQAVRSLAW
ncbi:hypothetical protein [Spartinivicinus ruber]|uniref:hypothetical protein n=1 Tax=Spartinivicinus ruber TaxID=2683272 RepID=UPI0013D3DCF6|nr:hypothetical protein [Spartinivicinus ruber]